MGLWVHGTLWVYGTPSTVYAVPKLDGYGWTTQFRVLVYDWTKMLSVLCEEEKIIVVKNQGHINV